MTEYQSWCDTSDYSIGDHDLTLLTTDDARVEIGIGAVKAALPGHYAATARVSRMLRRLGKEATADYVLEKMPTNKTSRSGDLCEVLALAFIEKETIFSETIRKLRWSDHREQPMRGDDMIAVAVDDEHPDRLFFLKGEAKSRARLSKPVIGDARKALRSHNGRPSPHALAFFADRLAEEGREEISDLVDNAQRVTGITTDRITQMIFAFSGNNPEGALESDLKKYKGKIEQWSIGLRVKGHQEFIAAVYDGVNLDGID